MGNHQTDI